MLPQAGLSPFHWSKCDDSTSWANHARLEAHQAVDSQEFDVICSHGLGSLSLIPTFVLLFLLSTLRYSRLTILSETLGIVGTKRMENDHSPTGDSVSELSTRAPALQLQLFDLFKMFCLIGLIRDGNKVSTLSFEICA